MLTLTVVPALDTAAVDTTDPTIRSFNAALEIELMMQPPLVLSVGAPRQ